MTGMVTIGYILLGLGLGVVGLIAVWGGHRFGSWIVRKIRRPAT